MYPMQITPTVAQDLLKQICPLLVFDELFMNSHCLVHVTPLMVLKVRCSYQLKFSASVP